MNRSSKFTSIISILLNIAIFVSLSGCGKTRSQKLKEKEQTEVIERLPEEIPYVAADVPGVQLSEVLLRIKGRWRQEIEDPRTPNPPKLELFAIGDDKLRGRFMAAGPFEDAGVNATLTQNGKEFMLELIDDDLRPHDPAFPRQRIFIGTYDEKERILSFKSQLSGEWIQFKYARDANGEDYKIVYSAQVYRCTPILTAPPAPEQPGSNPGSGSTPNPGGVPPGGVSPGSGPTSFFQENRMNLGYPLAMTFNLPASGAHSCGIMSSENEDWSRISGAY